MTAGGSLAAGLPRGTRPTQTTLAREAVRSYVGLDAAVLGLVLTIGVVIPLYAATRDHSLHGTSLNVIASMVFLPGLISAVVWGVRNWRTYDEITQTASQRGVSLVALERAGGNWQLAHELDDLRVRRLHLHLTCHRGSVVALMAVGLGYLAIVLLQ
jgi:hypothetical protein